MYFKISRHSKNSLIPIRHKLNPIHQIQAFIATQFATNIEFSDFTTYHVMIHLAAPGLLVIFTTFMTDLMKYIL